MAKKNTKVGAKAPGAGKGELANKEYEKELKKLHVELVKLQLWVRGWRSCQLGCSSRR